MNRSWSLAKFTLAPSRLIHFARDPPPPAVHTILLNVFGVGVSCRNLYFLLFIYMLTVVDQLPRFGKRELICLLLFT